MLSDFPCQGVTCVFQGNTTREPVEVSGVLLKSDFVALSLKAKKVIFEVGKKRGWSGDWRLCWGVEGGRKMVVGPRCVAQYPNSLPAPSNVRLLLL